jgi:ABC-type bacteriocin/lantibiotic exporter with double-glycine peptidase domain
MFLPFMNKQIFDSIIPSGTKSDILPMASLLIGAAVGSALFGVTRGIILSRFNFKIDLAVQSAAIARDRQIFIRIILPRSRVCMQSGNEAQ